MSMETKEAWRSGARSGRGKNEPSPAVVRKVSQGTGEEVQVPTTTVSPTRGVG